MIYQLINSSQRVPYVSKPLEIATGKISKWWVLLGIYPTKYDFMKQCGQVRQNQVDKLRLECLVVYTGIIPPAKDAKTCTFS